VANPGVGICTAEQTCIQRDEFADSRRRIAMGHGNSMAEKSGDDGASAAVPPAGRAPRTISSRDLLGGQKLLVIRHEDEIYRLQLTAAGKLILTK